MKTEPEENDPWAVLGLMAATATLADVKRAYARLLKDNRPDQNREGFMRLRSAYEVALGVLNGGMVPAPLPMMQPPEGETAAEPPAVLPAAVIKPAPELHAEIKQALEMLRQAVASKVRQKVRLAWAGYEAVTETHELTKESRWLLFIELFAGNIPLLADSCTDERLLEHIKFGEMRLLRLVTDLWSKQGDAKRLDEFCVSLSRQRQLADSEPGALAMVVTAIALGAWNPEQSARLAQRAFPRLPTSQRTELAGMVDFETMLGRLVGPLPQAYKIPWVEVLRYGEGDKPWNEVITREMVVALLRYCGPSWPGLAVLGQRLKPQSWLELKALAESMLR